jgi:hypothetical protein
VTGRLSQALLRTGPMLYPVLAIFPGSAAGTLLRWRRGRRLHRLFPAGFPGDGERQPDRRTHFLAACPETTL